ncbi:MAG: tyrosine-type recombinase/integrase [Planctomycetes bacterium]|nr:tyrosine-type recombinase/integrase [Planctomycetota bacterium]
MKRHRTMVQKATSYLAYRRSLGFKLRDHGQRLMHFAEFLDRHRHRGPLTTQAILRWLEMDPAAQRCRAGKMSAVRGFARYLALRDGRTQVPDTRLVPGDFRRRRPHIYTTQQLRQLLAAASRMKLQCALGPLTYRTFFGLLASTGLRISEAMNLTGGHVDLKRGILRIEHTKSGATRLVPLHPTTVQALRRYATARDRRWGARQERSFFLASHGRALMKKQTQFRFRQLCEGLGWHRGNGEMAKPRIHDLRHTFACQRLLRWYREGENIHQMIVALSTYLGHKEVTYTYWYLTGTAELLGIAGDRFEKFARTAGGRHV